MTVEYTIRICGHCRKDCSGGAHLIWGPNRRTITVCSRCRARVEMEAKG